METTDASYQHQVQLYNVTTSSPVSTPLGSNSLTPDFQGDELVSPADLPAGDNVYAGVATYGGDRRSVGLPGFG
ncbi:hypothetical protein LCGC14_2699160 [marine sediment metagenome]|uniref:Uncharacterized protein n=1 Tax=marine sediment metagenome TaxID=412755 RepID=A0A0F9BQK9_9ZZZZ